MAVVASFIGCEKPEDPNASTYPALSGEYYYITETPIEDPLRDDYKVHESASWTFDATRKATYFYLYYKQANASQSVNYPDKKADVEEREWKVEGNSFMYRKWGSTDEFKTMKFEYAEDKVVIGTEYKKGSLDKDNL